MPSFQQRLAKKRKEIGLSQTELAEKIRVARSTVAMWETGDRHPDYETLQKLADFFDVTIDFLIGRSDEEKPVPPSDELDSWGLSEEDMVFFKDFASLSEEDKQKAIEHIKFLKHLAEQKNKEDN